MSRNTLTLIVILIAGITGLILYGRFRPHQPVVPPPESTTELPLPASRPALVPRIPVAVSPLTSPPPAAPTVTLAPPAVSNITTSEQPLAAPPTLATVEVTNAPAQLAALEERYKSSTDLDARLDAIIDITEFQSADSIKTLTKLFQVETNEDMKIDLVDSLQGFEGFKEEKLALLTLGSKPGQPDEVRQSAIDGLIDLEDPRGIPVLETLLNDSNEEIRESAKDAIEILKSPDVLK